jgi:hypothetical protein
VNGISTSDRSGFAVSGAGDVNGDGLDDILIGAPSANPNGSDSGQSYVVYGGTAVPATVELSALDGSSGFRVNGISTYDYSGFAVSGAGDVNGDGLGDILIGARYADPNGSASGQSYVVYGDGVLPAPPTAAQVAHFTARVAATGGVTLAWETASEADVLGFNVYRAAQAAAGGAGDWARVNRALVLARGSAADGAAYTLVDAPGVGAFSYRLEVVDAQGASERHGPVEAVVRALRAFLPWGGR